MQTESFEVVGSDAGWVVSHNGADGMPYATKEAAFEAAVAAASNAVRDGRDVSIVVQVTRPADRAVGDKWAALS